MIDLNNDFNCYELMKVVNIIYNSYNCCEIDFGLILFQQLIIADYSQHYVVFSIDPLPSFAHSFKHRYCWSR